MTETMHIAKTESTKEQLQKLYEEQNTLKEEINKYEQTIGDILYAFETREVLKWKQEKKIAKMKLLNKFIPQYNETRN